MVFNHLSHFLDWLQLTPPCLPIPLFKEFPCTACIVAIPEVIEGLFNRVGAATFRPRDCNSLKWFCISSVSFQILSAKGICSSSVCHLSAGTVSCAPATNFVDCLLQMRTDMEAVVHDISIWQMLRCRFDVGSSHIHSNGFDII